MKIISNERLIKRNRRIGNIASLGALVILGVGMFFSFKDKDGTLLPYTFGTLIIGFLVFQLGNYYMSKWGKSPRPDEIITSALKGLDDKYTLYHYSTEVSHLLIGPAGFLCLLSFQQAGVITYDVNRNRWKQTGGNFFMKTFGGENLGHPENELRYTLSEAEKILKKLEISTKSIEPEAIILFSSEKAILQVENSPVPALPVGKIKEYIRRKAKENPLSMDMINQINVKLVK